MKGLSNLHKPWVQLRYKSSLKFILPEARSSLILNLTTATISLIGATAMAGAVGAGGIGDLAISYGYQRFDTSVVILTVIVLLIMVQIAQSVGDWLSKLR